MTFEVTIQPPDTKAQRGLILCVRFRFRPVYFGEIGGL